MPIVIPDGYAQLNVRMALGLSTQTAECTFGVNFDDPADCEQVLDAWGTQIMPLVTNVWTYVHGQARVQAGLITEKTYTTIGGNSGNSAAPNLCYLIRKNTGLPGRANKGRMYVPGVVETAVDGTGLLTSGAIGGMNTQMAALLSAIAAAPSGGFGVMVVLHNQSVSTPPPSNVNSLTTQQLCATQRRRMRG
jgi:hypothetical protein